MEDAKQHFLDLLHANPERYFNAYRERFGNVLNADDAATLFDDYNASPLEYRVAVHAAATGIRDRLFEIALSSPTSSEKSFIVFTAGGNASGKSTAVKFIHAIKFAHAVLDSTLSNIDHARRLILTTLHRGFQVIILHVTRPLRESFLGMLERSRVEGRVVSIAQMIHSARGAAEAVQQLQVEFAVDRRVSFRFVDNAGEGTHELLSSPIMKSYAEYRDELDAILDTEYHAGRIADEVCRRIRGPRHL